MRAVQDAVRARRRPGARAPTSSIDVAIANELGAEQLLPDVAIQYPASFVGDRLPTSSTQFLPSLIFGLVIVVLLLRPSGLFAPVRRAPVERV